MIIYYESKLPVCDKPYHKIKENMPLGEELEKLWNYPLVWVPSSQSAFKEVKCTPA